MAGVACGSEDVENNFIGAANESQIAVVKLKKAKKNRGPAGDGYGFVR